MKKKISIIAVLALLISGLFALVAQADWVKTSDGRYYFDNNGTRVTSDWIRVTGQSGTYTYYYMGEDGYMATGWKKIKDDWYYFKTSGAMATGWVQDGSDWYYCSPTSGKMQKGWLNLDGKYYFLRSNGAMVTGWRQQDGAWYYFQEDGSCILGKWAQIDGKWYCFGTDGKMQTGWYKQDGNYYFLASSGELATGWLKDSSKNAVYYCDPTSGILCQNGWKQIDGSWYYFDANGKMATGWLNLNGTYYYLQADGKMAYNTTLTIDGQTYSFAANGAYTGQTGTQTSTDPSSSFNNGPTAEGQISGPGGGTGGPGTQTNNGNVANQGPGGYVGGSSTPTSAVDQNAPSTPGTGSQSLNTGSLTPNRTDGPGF